MDTLHFYFIQQIIKENTQKTKVKGITRTTMKTNSIGNDLFKGLTENTYEVRKTNKENYGIKWIEYRNTYKL